MDYVKVRLLSFVAIQCGGLACFSQFNHSKDKPVLRPGERHEGVGRKKKKTTRRKPVGVGRTKNRHIGARKWRQLLKSGFAQGPPL